MKKLICGLLLSFLLFTGCIDPVPFAGNQQAYGSIVPNQDVTFNLGSPTNRWHNIYVENVITAGGGLTHTQNTDQFLDFGGASQVAVADVKDAVTKKHTQGTDTTLGAMSASINMNTHQIVSVVDPTNAQDAATKNYVDTAVAGAGGVPSGLTDMRLVEEFLGGGTSSGTIGELGWMSSVASIYGWDGLANHPGIIRIGNSYTVPSVNYLKLGSGSLITRTVIPQDIEYIALVMTPQSGTSLLAMRFGLLYLSSASQETTNGIYFSFNSPVSNKWRAITKDALGTTATTTTQFYANGTWYQLEIIQNGANWEFWINGVLEATHSTNITTTYCSPTIALEVLTGGANNEELTLDYFEIRSKSGLVRYP